MAPKSWNQIISGFHNPSILQTSQWAAVKTQTGWEPYYLIWQTSPAGLEMRRSRTGQFDELHPSAAALILERSLLPGISVMYAPKGPLLADWADRDCRERVLSDLESYGKQAGAIQLKIDPDLELGRGVPGEAGSDPDPDGENFQAELAQHGWLYSSDQIQFRNTVLVDLLEEEDQILARMKSKTRYNIRLAGRKGITVRLGTEADLAGLYKMYAKTSVRGGFTIREGNYYQTVWRTFLADNAASPDDPSAQPLVAEYQGQPVAGAVIFKFANRAWYLHGMSLPEHSDKMAPHLIQWEAMRWAKSQGCTIYDMWGAPEKFDQSDSMWGVYRFKSGYGGEVVRTLGAWDFPAKPFYYGIYTNWVPKILDVLRWFGERRTSRISGEGEG
jgi:lipid II:glycine glycyltransferase (peptidoglycan interpeptide bridge formation enzyme)